MLRSPVLVIVIIVAVFLLMPRQMKSSTDVLASELVGLWEAKRRFGPDIRGSLIIRRTGAGWLAEIAGKDAEVNKQGNAISFQLPDELNSFQGSFNAVRTRIAGHWIQPPTLESGSAYASPLILNPYGSDQWRGNLAPLDSTMTLYLMIEKGEDGSFRAFLRNPERNIGWTRQYRVDSVAVDGESVKLLSEKSGNEDRRVLANGLYHREVKVLSIFFPNRGGTFDFKRVQQNEISDFYPRGRATSKYTYTKPVALDDGWATALVEDVGLSRDAIEKFVQMIIDTPIDSVHAHEVHGVLIARNGKLVLEEYFHGEHREKPHDTRSAAKSLTATLAGAAMQAGVKLELSSPVYQIMNGGTFSASLEPRKRALTVEHLLTMSSGFDCDDNDENSPGREDYMVDESGEPDYYKFTMALSMIRDPGEMAVYCSVNPNLLGGVLKHASAKTLPVLFHEVIAEPLQINRYYMNLTPTGDAYMAGGVRLTLRDFLKIGQLHLNGGIWNDRRILSEEWVRRATSPLYEVKDYKPLPPYQFLRYGYLWWVIEYPYEGRTIRAFFAGGNGGQSVMGIPELDLVVGFYAGNYGDQPTKEISHGYVPKFILPSIQ